MEPILQIENLSITFTQYSRGARRRELPVIRDLCLSLHPGEVKALVGASGSGKSLLAHAILGLLPANSHCEGKMLYDGAPLTERRLKALRGRELSLVPQGVTYLDPLMAVGAQLSPKRAGRGRAREALARYGLPPGTEKLYPFQLSGGMARRVLMASAVMEAPRLVIADEPTPGLDPAAAGRVLGHFRQLAQQGAAVLFITHDLEQALSAAHRVAVFYAGETIEEAAVEDFPSNRLRHPFTRALWDALPQRGFCPLPGAQPYPGEETGGCPFRPRCPHPGPACGAPAPLSPFEGGLVRCHYPGKEPAP